MEVEYRLYWEDYDAFQRHHFGTRRTWRYWFEWFFWAVVVIASGYGIFFSTGFPCWAFWVLVIVGMYAWVWVMNWKRRRGVARDLDHYFLKGNAKTKLASDGMYLVDPNYQNFTAWSDILRISETPTHAFFYTHIDVAVIVPARAFPSPVEFRTFVTLARKYQEALAAVKPQPPEPSDEITRKTDFSS